MFTTMQTTQRRTGIALTVVGQILRSSAMIHAARSFSHVIAMRKVDGHVLVTDGIYRSVRHPYVSPMPSRQSGDTGTSGTPRMLASFTGLSAHNSSCKIPYPSSGFSLCCGGSSRKGYAVSCTTSVQRIPCSLMPCVIS